MCSKTLGPPCDFFVTVTTHQRLPFGEQSRPRPLLPSLSFPRRIAISLELYLSSNLMQYHCQSWNPHAPPFGPTPRPASCIFTAQPRAWPPAPTQSLRVCVSGHLEAALVHLLHTCGWDRGSGCGFRAGQGLGNVI